MDTKCQFLSGEIVEQHKNKNITIVSASEKLVSQDFDDKFQDTIRNIIEQKNVKVGENKRIKNYNNIDRSKLGK